MRKLIKRESQENNRIIAAAIHKLADGIESGSVLVYSVNNKECLITKFSEFTLKYATISQKPSTESDSDGIIDLEPEA